MRSWYRKGRWRRLRLQVLTEGGYACASCGDYGDEVDHIVPRRKSLAQFFDRDNLQILCRDCHIKKTRRDNNRYSEVLEAWDEHLSTLSG